MWRHSEEKSGWSGPRPPMPIQHQNYFTAVCKTNDTRKRARRKREKIGGRAGEREKIGGRAGARECPRASSALRDVDSIDAC
jgi:hypothetical protein